MWTIEGMIQSFKLQFFQFCLHSSSSVGRVLARHLDQNLVPFGLVGLSNLEFRVVSVSYTHLDVYKRQHHNISHSHSTQRVLPVSYTHLDVYKRQAIDGEYSVFG